MADGRAEIDAAIARILEKVASAIESDAKAGCPRDTGKLAASITHSVDGRTARIGTDVEYALSVEFGSKPHVIRPNGHPFLKFPDGRTGGDVFAREVHHPGTPEQPFLRPALFRTRDVA
jgi:hypothetical protein